MGEWRWEGGMTERGWSVAVVGAAGLEGEMGFELERWRWTTWATVILPVGESGGEPSSRVSIEPRGWLRCSSIEDPRELPPSCARNAANRAIVWAFARANFP